MNNEVNLEYELNISDVLYKMICWHNQEGITTSIFLCWSKKIARHSLHKVFKYLDPKEYDRLDNEYWARYDPKVYSVAELVQYSGIFNDKSKLIKSLPFYNEEYDEKIDEIIKSKDSYIFYTPIYDGNNLYLTKSNFDKVSKKYHFLKIELDEYKMKDFYPDLFLAKMHIIEAIEIFHFLDYQLKVNFENDIEKFKDFYRALKYYSIEDESKHIYDKSNEAISEWIKKRENIENINLEEKNKTIIELENKIKELEVNSKEIFNKGKYKAIDEFKFNFEKGSFSNTQLTHLINFLFYYRNNLNDSISSKKKSEALLILTKCKNYYKGNQFEKSFSNYYNIHKASKERDKEIILDYLKKLETPDILEEFKDYSKRFM